MINEITSDLKQYRTQMKTAAAPQPDTFAELLAENLQQGTAAPRKITEEQKAWLRSRYDLNDLRVSSEETFTAPDGTVQGYRHYTREYKDFLGDLVYLNVLTQEEAAGLGTVIVPAHTAVFRRAEGASAPDENGEEADSFIDALRRIAERQREYIAYIAEKSENPLTAQPEDTEYLRRANDFLADKMRLYDILLDLF